MSNTTEIKYKLAPTDRPHMSVSIGWLTDITARIALQKQALQELQRELEAMPGSSDAENSPWPLYLSALVYMAVEQLELVEDRIYKYAQVTPSDPPEPPGALMQRLMARCTLILQRIGQMLSPLVG